MYPQAVEAGGVRLSELTQFNILSGAADTGIHIVEECLLAAGHVVYAPFDAGLHWSEVDARWAAIKETDRQVFLTLYSQDALLGAVKAFADDLAALSMHRLERYADGSIHVHDFGGEVLKTAWELGFEVR